MGKNLSMTAIFGICIAYTLCTIIIIVEFVKMQDAWTGWKFAYFIGIGLNFFVFKDNGNYKSNMPIKEKLICVCWILIMPVIYFIGGLIGLSVLTLPLQILGILPSDGPLQALSH